MNAVSAELRTPADKQDLRKRGLKETHIRTHLEHLSRGSHRLAVSRACRAGDGIRRIAEKEREGLAAAYAPAQAAGRAMKFVPASGAATRLFATLQAFRSQNPDADLKRASALAEKGDAAARHALDFVKGIENFAFYDYLSKHAGAKCDKVGDILAAVLEDDRLGYSQVPKALLPFHKTAEGPRTALEEHWVEAAEYIASDKRLCRIHLTVLPEHRKKFEAFVKNRKKLYERRLDCRLDLSFSTQDPSTETIALDASGRPFRKDDGRLLFRPGGHGALLKNLNALGGDVVFIKNIDNVMPEPLMRKAAVWKKVLGGLLVRLQGEIFERIAALRKKNAGVGEVDAALEFIESEIGVKVPPAARRGSSVERRDYAVARLDRPLRVCGMIENQGDPGGGPFWVDDGAGECSAQILESAQLAPDQKYLEEQSTHFNPVDIVCGLRDWRGRPFDLERFSDGRQVFITEKSHAGRPLRGFEWPGLWNGGMALWNTVFVEVPRDTFHPVKTINDLLSPAHQVTA